MRGHRKSKRESARETEREEERRFVLSRDGGLTVNAALTSGGEYMTTKLCWMALLQCNVSAGQSSWKRLILVISYTVNSPKEPNNLNSKRC